MHAVKFDKLCSVDVRSARRMHIVCKEYSLREGVDMLVLSRKVGEEIVVGKDVRVRILEVVGNRVRLGIIAPQTVSIRRQGVREGESDRSAT